MLLVVEAAQPVAQLDAHLGVERPNGSSSSKTLGEIARARANATRCRCPPESSAG